MSPKGPTLLYQGYKQWLICALFDVIDMLTDKTHAAPLLGHVRHGLGRFRWVYYMLANLIRFQLFKLVSHQQAKWLDKKLAVTIGSIYSVWR